MEKTRCEHTMLYKKKRGKCVGVGKEQEHVIKVYLFLQGIHPKVLLSEDEKTYVEEKVGKFVEDPLLPLMKE